jgi:hypothetical protein
VGMSTGFTFSGQCPAADCCEHGNEHSGPIRNKEFVDSLANCRFLKDFTPWSYVFVCGIRLAEKSHFKSPYCAYTSYFSTKPIFGARR